MITTTLPPMRPELVVCPNSACGASGRSGVHSIKARRYKGHGCGTTCAETTGTPLFGLKHPRWLVLLILALRAHGCPVPAIVVAVGRDERTVADWQRKAARHARQVHQQVVCQGQVDVGQVQADERYTKTQAGPVWIATALRVFARLWRWGAISWDRDPALVAPVIVQVRAAAQPGRPILFAVDRCKAYVTTIRKVFRDRQPTGKRGRPPLVVWADRHSVQVVKHRVGRRLVRITRQLAQGWRGQADAIMQATQVELGCSNTAYIERLNATLRTWMPALVRRTRTPAGARDRLEAALFWTGGGYHFCHVHATLAGTPAMAADLTDHGWSIDELIRYRCQRE